MHLFQVLRAPRLCEESRSEICCQTLAKCDRVCGLWPYCYASQSRRCIRAQDLSVGVGFAIYQNPVGLLSVALCQSPVGSLTLGGWGQCLVGLLFVTLKALAQKSGYCWRIIMLSCIEHHYKSDPLLNPCNGHLLLGPEQNIYCG